MRYISMLVLGALLATSSVVCAMGPAKTSNAVKSSPSASPSLDILGLKFGARISLAECPLDDSNPAFDKFRGHQSYKSAYMVKEAAPCYQQLYRTPPYLINTQYDEVKVIVASTPYPVKVDGISATVIDGRLEAVALQTRGLKVQQDMLDLLTEKYGKPTTLDVSKVQNRMGAGFDQIDATWAFTDLSITFIGMGSKIDWGLVVIKTPKGEQVANEKNEAAKAAAPKL